jgi:hypothetical protein
MQKDSSISVSVSSSVVPALSELKLSRVTSPVVNAGLPRPAHERINRIGVDFGLVTLVVIHKRVPFNLAAFVHDGCCVGGALGSKRVPESFLDQREGALDSVVERHERASLEIRWWVTCVRLAALRRR